MGAEEIFNLKGNSADTSLALIASGIIFSTTSTIGAEGVIGSFLIIVKLYPHPN